MWNKTLALTGEDEGRNRKTFFYKTITSPWDDLAISNFVGEL